MNANQQRAADLLAAAIRTALDASLYKNAQFVVASSPVGGQREDVTCVVFADSAHVTHYIESRICTPTSAELAGLPPQAPRARDIVSFAVHGSA